MSNLNKVYKEEQRSIAWHHLRAGKITSSNANKIMKSRGLGVGGNTYCLEITSGLLKEYFEETYVSQSMQQGIDREPIAKEIYEEEELTIVNEVGFVVYYTDNPDLEHLNGFLGISPDGLVGKDGGLEIKCPESNQHTANLTEEVCSDKYYDQIQMCLFVTGRKWWDLISFNPDFKDGYKWKITRNYPDQKWQELFIERATLCKKKVDENLEKIRN